MSGRISLGIFAKSAAGPVIRHLGRFLDRLALDVSRRLPRRVVYWAAHRMLREVVDRRRGMTREGRMLRAAELRMLHVMREWGE